MSAVKQSLPQQDLNLNSLDTRRFDGMKSTSLDVLNSKRHHKTQTQKQFQQFNKNHRQSYAMLKQSQQMQLQAQQQYQQQYQQQQQQQYQMHTLAPPMSAPPPKSGSLRSFQSYNSFSDVNLPYNNVLPQTQFTTSSPDFSSSYNVSPTSGSLTYNEDGYTTSPSNNEYYNDELLAYSNERIKELEMEIENLKTANKAITTTTTTDNSNIKEMEDMNSLLLKENQQLRLEIKKNENPIHQTISNTSSIETVKELESKTNEYNELNRKHESLELNYEALVQELNKLKLIHKSTTDTKNKEIKRLKDENTELEKELESLYENSVSTGVTSPSIPAAKEHATPLSPNLNAIKENDTYQQEIIQQLLITIRSLRSDNEILNNENSVLSETVSRQKKIVRRLAENKNEKAKIRKGLCLLESVDVLI